MTNGMKASVFVGIPGAKAVFSKWNRWISDSVRGGSRYILVAFALGVLDSIKKMLAFRLQESQRTQTPPSLHLHYEIICGINIAIAFHKLLFSLF